RQAGRSVPARVPALMSVLSPRFPHGPVLRVGGRLYAAEAVRAALAPYVSEARRARIAEVVAARTYAVLPALERMADAGNLHAVLRSAEGLGYAAAALVAPTREAFPLARRYAAGRGADASAPVAEADLGKRGGTRAAGGAHKWLDLTVWPDVDAWAEDARARGYAVVATYLGAGAVPIAEWDFTRSTALVFGNEKAGVSERLLARAVARVVLPLDGFVQSYNVSVAAALALYHARQDRLARQGRHGDLTEAERDVLTAHYYLRSVQAAPHLLARALGA